MLNLISWHAISFLGNTKLLVPLSIIMILWLYWQRQKKAAWLVSIVFYSGILLNGILKQLFQLPRPPASPIGGYGFPSGHAMNAAIFYSLIIILFMHQIKDTKIKYIFLMTNIIIILMVGLSRIMLKVHYISDVLGGFAFGLLWVWLLVMVYRRTLGKVQD